MTERSKTVSAAELRTADQSIEAHSAVVQGWGVSLGFLLLFRGRGWRGALPFPKQGVVHTLFETPSLWRPHVRVRVVAVVLDLVGIAAETDHQHVYGAGGAFCRRGNDMIRVDVAHALRDPRHVLAAVRSAARDGCEPFSTLNRS